MSLVKLKRRSNVHVMRVDDSHTNIWRCALIDISCIFHAYFAADFSNTKKAVAHEIYA